MNTVTGSQPPSGVNAGGTPMQVTFESAYGNGAASGRQYEGELYPRPHPERPVKQRTQSEQDKADADAKRKANKDLVQSWNDRLQLISVITTFFASVESQLLGNTGGNGGPMSKIQQAAGAGLTGALVIHSFAAIVSFLGAFFLVRYRVKEAKKEEMQAQSHAGPINNTMSTSPVDVEKSAEAKPTSQQASSNAPVFSSEPHLEQVGPPFSKQLPMGLLSRCYHLCLLLSFVGFVLALMGILCSAWAQMPSSVSIFASACLGACLLGLVGMFFDIWE